ncbi:DUF6084 family protein [Nonomuraea muscovyensis]|uniref:Uncharacterized protein n=1 Tax=Nonomuraea muscovyensis TaxID=1124761 RepID=A0A7X0F1F4_9ACTN|nr:DUF6084 family protein [Nonomuraea muscovyensis]MBB6348636.1 hypothetical protein [Nonomuraea muscovyensis]
MDDVTTAGAPALRMAVEGVRAAEFAAVPMLEFALRITNPDGPEVRSVTLDTQIRISAARRAYDEPSRQRLAELFGGPEAWSRNLRSLLWAQTVTQVPAFGAETVATIRVPCTYDFEVAVAKYFHGLTGGDVPLEFLFGGTTWYLADGRLRATRIPWDTEADFRMPVAVWKDVMDRHFPGGAWLRLGRDTFDRLHAYRIRHVLPGWDDVVGRLLKEGGG